MQVYSLIIFNVSSCHVNIIIRTEPLHTYICGTWTHLRGRQVEFNKITKSYKKATYVEFMVGDLMEKSMRDGVFMAIHWTKHVDYNHLRVEPLSVFLS